MYLQSSFLNADEKEQVKFFGFFVMLPKVLLIIVWAATVIASIVMLIDEVKFWVAFLTLISGGVTGLLIYAWLRISYSYKILHILYQQIIINNLVQLELDINAKAGEITTKTKEMQEDISLLRQAYVEMETEETAK